MRIEDSIFWILLSGGLIIISIFPQIPAFFSRILGFISPSNFIFIAIIFLLILKVFMMSIHLSQLENKLHSLAQKYAVDHAKSKEK